MGLEEENSSLKPRASGLSSQHLPRLAEPGNQGVEVNVKRQGTAGDVPVGTVVDALITDVDAGTERGRIEIARTGDRIEQGLAMPVLAPVGVLLPGTLLRATGQWTGLVTGVAITVQRGEALDVQQQVSVERAP